MFWRHKMLPKMHIVDHKETESVNGECEGCNWVNWSEITQIQSVDEELELLFPFPISPLR